MFWSFLKEKGFIENLENSLYTLVCSLFLHGLYYNSKCLHVWSYFLIWNSNHLFIAFYVYVLWVLQKKKNYPEF